MHKKLRTRLIATLGPASTTPEMVEALMKAGTSMFRNNFSHMSHAEYRQRRQLVREQNRRLGTDVMMLADLQGPHIRLGELPEEGVLLKERHTYTFVTTGGYRQPDELPINDPDLHKHIKVGEPIAFANGLVEGEVTGVHGHSITVRMINSGTVTSHKAINIPETELDSCLTEKDRADLKFLIEEGVEWLGLSFVSRKEEIEEVREMIGNKHIKIMSKIERRRAVENMAEIVAASDAVMVARGDLGVELPMQDVPFIQKDIIALCHQARKPVVVATQMLFSLVHSLRPTRAEVSDVANAVCERADGLLLSDETTVGVDPVNAVETMATIAERAEQHLYHEPNFFEAA